MSPIYIPFKGGKNKRFMIVKGATVCYGQIRWVVIWKMVFVWSLSPWCSRVFVLRPLTYCI